MAKYKVSQVRDLHNEPRLGIRWQTVKSKTVNEDQVSATRADFRAGMRTNDQESSDSIQVHPAK